MYIAVALNTPCQVLLFFICRQHWALCINISRWNEIFFVWHFSHRMTASIKNIKNTRKDYLVDELTIKLEQKDHSNASHCFEPVNFSNHRLEQRIVATSKTIVYLFSPDIDLLENIESNI
jgi:hypothetical protein